MKVADFLRRAAQRNPVFPSLLAGAVVLGISVPGATPAQAELPLQQGLVLALSAEREAIRHIALTPARLDLGDETRNDTARNDIAPNDMGSVSEAETEVSRAMRDDQRYELSWLLERPSPQRDSRQFTCLKEAIYHEARGEPIHGQFAVAEVILNRVDSPAYPNTVCDVVHQNAHMRNACQFSYACNGRSRDMNERRARRIAARIADIMLSGAERELTDGATHFHTTTVNPGWARRLVRTAQIGVHIFYRPATRYSGG